MKNFHNFKKEREMSLEDSIARKLHYKQQTVTTFGKENFSLRP
jgi:hypothetical protein